MFLSKHRKFTNAEEAKIINFVKNNEILYNNANPGFKNIGAKYQLWSILAKDLNKDCK